MNVKEEYIKTYHKEIRNYYDLMDIIQGKGDFKDFRNDYIFRGLNNTNHSLIPSSLRNNSLINKYINDDFKFKKLVSREDAIEMGLIADDAKDSIKWVAPTVDKNNNILKDDGYSLIYSDDGLQFKKELYVLLKFLDFSDRNGLKLSANYEVRHNIHNYFNFKSQSWPKKEFIEIISLAQHYGLPTKVLDWTYDYKVSLYFALRDVVDDTKEDSDGVIWAFNYKLFENNPFENELYFNKLHFYRPEYNNNPNLRAQRGLFTFIIDDINNNDTRSLEDIIIDELISKKEYNQEDWAGRRQPRVLPPKIKINEPIFYKFIIDKDIKVEMLKELYSDGYSEEFLFPGFEGVKLAMENSVILEEKIKNPILSSKSIIFPIKTSLDTINKEKIIYEFTDNNSITKFKKIFIYSNGKIMGYLRGNEIVKDNPENLWVNYGKYSDLTESKFFSKFKNKKIVFAIKLDQTTLFDYPFNLFDFEIESDFEIIEERDVKLNFLLNFE